MTNVRFTHIGGPTTLIEIGGWRLLTDPTFDPPGRKYAFGWGTSSRKVASRTVPCGSRATVLPVHYEGWTHFRQGRDAIEPVFAAAPAEVRDSVRWLPMGVATEVEV